MAEFRKGESGNPADRNRQLGFSIAAKWALIRSLAIRDDPDRIVQAGCTAREFQKWAERYLLMVMPYEA